MNDLSHLTGLVDKTLTAIEKRFFKKYLIFLPNYIVFILKSLMHKYIFRTSCEF